MWLAYVILLPDDLHNYMRRVQADLYDLFEASHTTLGLEPHITLKQPFETGELAPHDRCIDRLAVETEPFEIVVRGFGFFESEGVVFLDVQQDVRLLALQRRILDELSLEPGEFESGRPAAYHFHATIATGLGPDDLADAREQLSETPEFRFPLEQLGLFRGAEERPWIVCKRAKL